MSPELARNRYAVMSELSPLSGVKRKLDFGAVRAAFDPTRTLAAPTDRQTGLSPIKNWTEPIRCQLPNLMATMRRRNFLGVLGGAAAWPLATRAQQTALPVVGMLGASSAASSATPLASFREGLRDAGFIE